MLGLNTIDPLLALAQHHMQQLSTRGQITLLRMLGERLQQDGAGDEVGLALIFTRPFAAGPPPQHRGAG